MSPIVNGEHTCPACDRPSKEHSSDENRACYLKIPHIIASLIDGGSMVCDASTWEYMHRATLMTTDGRLWCYDHQPEGVMLAAWRNDVFSAWTVYAFPQDYPSGFVVRRWVVTGKGEVPTAEAYANDSLDDLQESLIEMGLTRIAEPPEHDRHILETWV